MSDRCIRVIARNVTDIARVRSDFAPIDELARRARQRVFQARLVLFAHPEREHASAPIGQKARGECAMSMKCSRQIADDSLDRVP